MKIQKYLFGCLVVSLLFLTISVFGTTPINGKYYLSQWSSPSFSNALSELNTLNSPVVLVIDQNFTMTNSVTVDKEVSLEFISGNVITTSGNYLTIKGSVSVGLYQIFSGSNVMFSNTGSVSEVYPQWWGAKVDGTTDDTDEINAALKSLSTASPPGYTGWGIGTVRLTRGKWLVNGTIERESSIGIRFLGDGEYATSLITTANDKIMFDLDLYISVEFANMAIIHSSSTARNSWSNQVFRLDGAGGGRQLRLNHITTKGFDTVIKYDNVSAGNEDTTYAEHCTFIDCTVFLDSLSTQGVVNTFVNCTWGGAIKYGFYVAGSSRTKILSGNVVMDGSFIFFRNVANKYGPSALWLLENVKLEWTTAHSSSNSVAKLIDGEEGDYVSYYIRLVGCGLKGGSTPYSESLWGRFIGGAMQVDVVNCYFEGLVEVGTKTTYYAKNKSYLKFTGCSLTSPDSWVYDDSQVSGSVFPNISFEDCKVAITTAPITDITIAKKGAPYIQSERCTTISKSGVALPTIGYGGATAQLEMTTYGQTIEIKRISLCVNFRAGAAKTVYVYSDSARTNQIGSVSIPSGSNSGKEIYNIPLGSSPVLSSEGVYTSVYLDYTMTGCFIIEYGSR